MFRGQAGLQVFLLLLCFVAVPWMLLPKPLILKKRHEQRTQQARLCSRVWGAAAGCVGLPGAHASWPSGLIHSLAHPLPPLPPPPVAQSATYGLLSAEDNAFRYQRYSGEARCGWWWWVPLVLLLLLLLLMGSVHRCQLARLAPRGQAQKHAAPQPSKHAAVGPAAHLWRCGGAAPAGTPASLLPRLPHRQTAD